MPKELANGKPTTRRYSSEEKAAAVRMVRTLRAELGVTQGTVQRVATQLGYGVESVRRWVKQADIDDGVTPGVSSAEAQRCPPVHPRARGEQTIRVGIRGGRFGSSPRTRGTEPLPVRHRAARRFIPAHAGNSSPRSCRGA